jgi:hypothetical protein
VERVIVGEEVSKRNASRVLQVLVPLVGVSVTVISLLLTIAARKKELTCIQIASTRLVSENLGGIHPDLHVEFHGQPIGSLSKETFSLRNTGAAAIKGTDILEPVHLQFPPSTKLLTAIAERTSPSGFSFGATAAPDSNAINLSFSLLNAGDEAQFSVYLLNADVQKPTFAGRVVDVTQMSFVDASSASDAPPLPFFRSHAVRSIFRWTLSIIYGALTAIFIGFWVAALVSYLKYLPWKRKWKSEYDEVIKQLSRKERRQLEKAKAELASDSEEKAVLDREILWREIAVHRGVLQFVMPKGIEEELRKKGIPSHPDPTVETIAGLAGLSLLLLTLGFVCSLTFFLAYGGLRG